ncbi:MAG: zwf, partial [Bacteroidetes bacterium]|nr:zwf [Bacteroidota bacterium]
MTIRAMEKLLERNPLQEPTPAEKIPDACVMVIFGASGDLTKRKLVPAIFDLARQGLL